MTPKEKTQAYKLGYQRGLATKRQRVYRKKNLKKRREYNKNWMRRSRAKKAKK